MTYKLKKSTLMRFANNFSAHTINSISVEKFDIYMYSIIFNYANNFSAHTINSISVEKFDIYMYSIIFNYAFYLPLKVSTPQRTYKVKPRIINYKKKKT